MQHSWLLTKNEKARKGSPPPGDKTIIRTTVRSGADVWTICQGVLSNYTNMLNARTEMMGSNQGKTGKRKREKETLRGNQMKVQEAKSTVTGEEWPWWAPQQDERSEEGTSEPEDRVIRSSQIEMQRQKSNIKPNQKKKKPERSRSWGTKSNILT